MTDLIAIGPYHQHVIVGFFTPNYRELAEDFAANLSAYGEPYHLYAVSDADWKAAILLKPQIVLRAMKDYPLRTVILMDVDCTLSASLGYYAEGSADIAMHFRAKQKAKSTRINAVSRLVVFRPTAGAKALAETWRDCCAAPRARNDETQLMIALSKTPCVTVETIPCAAAPDEWANAHHPHVRHVSAHVELLGHNIGKSRLQKWRRQIGTRLLGTPYAQWKYGEG